MVESDGNLPGLFSVDERYSLTDDYFTCESGVVEFVEFEIPTRRTDLAPSQAFELSGLGGQPAAEIARVW